MAYVQHKRGLKANLPSSNLKAGELHFTTDQHTIHIPTDATTMEVVVPDIAGLTTIPSIDVTSDLLLISDTSDSGKKAKKVTVQALKDSLNIPAASTDEKVAVVSGGTSGYLYGTDGTDGILRVNTSLTMTKDVSNGFITLAFNGADLGTF